MQSGVQVREVWRQRVGETSTRSRLSSGTEESRSSVCEPVDRLQSPSADLPVRCVAV